MPQLQNAIPVAAAPFKKFLRLVIFVPPLIAKGVSLGPIVRIAGLFLISSLRTLPSLRREGNHPN
jgi:hypothetical protein